MTVGSLCKASAQFTIIILECSLIVISLTTDLSGQKRVPGRQISTLMSVPFLFEKTAVQRLRVAASLKAAMTRWLCFWSSWLVVNVRSEGIWLTPVSCGVISLSGLQTGTMESRYGASGPE